VNKGMKRGPGPFSGPRLLYGSDSPAVDVYQERHCMSANSAARISVEEVAARYS